MTFTILFYGHLKIYFDHKLFKKTNNEKFIIIQWVDTNVIEFAISITQVKTFNASWIIQLSCEKKIGTSFKFQNFAQNDFRIFKITNIMQQYYFVTNTSTDVLYITHRVIRISSSFK